MALEACNSTVVFVEENSIATLRYGVEKISVTDISAL